MSTLSFAPRPLERRREEGLPDCDNQRRREARATAGASDGPAPALGGEVAALPREDGARAAKGRNPPEVSFLTELRKALGGTTAPVD